MNTTWRIVGVLMVILAVAAIFGFAQTGAQPTPSRTGTEPSPPAPPPAPPATALPPSPAMSAATVFEVRGDAGEVVRFGGDYTLRSDQQARTVVVFLGSARIEGDVKEEVVVMAGGMTLTGTARVRGDVVVLGGTLEVQEGAVVGGDMVVLGGGMDLPPDFTPGGDQVAIGTIHAGNLLMSVVPWITQGLFWGRPIVPSLPWMWVVVAVFVLLCLLINLVFQRPVHACAQVLADKPLSVGLVGMLIVLLIAPASLMLAVTIVGLVLIPFLWVLLLVAVLIGSAGLARWIGSRVLAETSPENRRDAARSLLIGLALLTLVYMVPVLGFAAWSLVWVLALGAAATEAFAGMRREYPPAPESSPPPPEPSSVVAGPVDEGPPAATRETASPDEVLDATDLSTLPRATFLYRFGAVLIDIVMVVFVTYLLSRLKIFGIAGAEKLFLVFVTYCVAHWGWKGTTVGGIICQLRIVRTDGAPIGFTEALVRGLTSVLSILVIGLGWLWILWDPERQAWHDKIAGTIVVRVPANWPR